MRFPRTIPPTDPDYIDPDALSAQIDAEVEALAASDRPLPPEAIEEATESDRQRRQRLEDQSWLTWWRRQGLVR